MSAHAATESHAESGHGHHGGADHVPHVLPLQWYFGVWIALLVFTVITVAVSYVDFGFMNMIIALVVATMKAAMVSLIFMHLAFDHKFNAVIFVSSLVFLGIFIGFTMSDTEGRGLAEAIEGERPADSTNPFGGTRSEMMLEKKAAARKAAAPAPSAPAPAAPAPSTPGPAAAPAPAPQPAAASAATGAPVTAPEPTKAPAAAGSPP